MRKIWVTMLIMMLLLGALYAWISRYPSSQELEARKGFLFEGFVRSKIDKIEIKPSCILLRQRNDPKELGVWTLMLGTTRMTPDETKLESTLGFLEHTTTRNASWLTSKNEPSKNRFVGAEIHVRFFSQGTLWGDWVMIRHPNDSFFAEDKLQHRQAYVRGESFDSLEELCP